MLEDQPIIREQLRDIQDAMTGDGPAYFALCTMLERFSEQAHRDESAAKVLAIVAQFHRLVKLAARMK